MRLARDAGGAVLRSANDLAIDLGSATTRVLLRGEGIVVDDETVAAREPRHGHVVSTGAEARVLVAADPRLELVNPVVQGAVADQRLAEEYLTKVLELIGSGWAGRIDMLATCSSGATPIERRALREVCRRAGAARVRLIEKSVAAALGAGVAVHDPAAMLVVELGAETTEAMLISLGSVVASAATRHGNSEVDDSIRAALRHEYGLRITDVAAERVKRAIDGAPGDSMVEARGTTVMDGESVTAIFESSELSVHLERHSQQVLDAVKSCLTKATAEMASDVISSGVLLTGGPASSASLVAELESDLGFTVRTVSDPRLAAVTGAGKCLEAVDTLSDLFVPDRH